MYGMFSTSILDMQVSENCSISRRGLSFGFTTLTQEPRSRWDNCNYILRRYPWRHFTLLFGASIIIRSYNLIDSDSRFCTILYRSRDIENQRPTLKAAMIFKV